MKLETHEQGQWVVVSCRGRLDSATYGELETLFSSLISKDKVWLVYDFGALEYMSSVALRQILTHSKECKKRQGKLVLVGISGFTYEILHSTGLDKVLDISDAFPN